MPTAATLFRRLYGDHVLHLLILIAALALAAYAIAVLGVKSLYNPQAWWQSIDVWFAVAVIGHDLILFPLYALAERLVPRPRRTPRSPEASDVHSQRVPLVNYVRMPTLAAGLLLLMFFPGIIEQGADAYRVATGLTQAPYLHRWLLIVAALYLTSALAYAARSVLVRRVPAAPAGAPGDLAATGTPVRGPAADHDGEA